MERKEQKQTKSGLREKANYLTEMKLNKCLNQRKNEGGITLIALVVTIIILLILAGVTLGLVLSDGGLIDKTKEAIGEHEKAQEKEQAELGEAAVMMKNLIDGLGSTGGTTPDTPPTPPKAEIPEGMKVGDVVHYTPDTTETSYTLEGTKSGYISDQTITKQDLEWKVLSINGDSVDIMGVPTKGEAFYFKGATGYNNGVYLLDEMCKKLYSNSELEVEARSIDLQDIEPKLNAAGKAARDAYTDTEGGGTYGQAYEYTGSYANYPKLAKYENILGIDDGEINANGIGESDDGTKVGEITIPLEEPDRSGYTNSKEKASNKITVKCNSYYFISPSTYFDDRSI